MTEQNSLSMPDYSVPARAMPLPLSPLGGLRIAATVLIALNVLAAVAVSWTYWHGYSVVRDYVDGVPGVTAADLRPLSSSMQSPLSPTPHFFSPRASCSGSGYGGRDATLRSCAPRLTDAPAGG
jgi:hypothetical protein